MKADPIRRRFVVQEHEARQLHYDFRLEMDGILKSWAITKGPSMNPKERRLAVLVDDHHLDYIAFEGVISDGQYGAGTVAIWDHGEYALVEGEDPLAAFNNGKIVMELQGKILKGTFLLVKMRGRGENNWLLIKKHDAYIQTQWNLTRALTK
jgi:bifunctional non-homologous end joining protein LigD